MTIETAIREWQARNPANTFTRDGAFTMLRQSGKLIFQMIKFDDQSITLHDQHDRSRTFGEGDEYAMIRTMGLGRI